MIRLNWRKPRLLRPMEFHLLEVQTGLHSKKAFCLLEKILQSKKTDELLERRKNNSYMLDTISLYSTRVILSEADPIYAIPNELGETVIFVKTNYIQPGLPPVGMAKVFMKSVIEANMTNSITDYTDDDSQLIRLKRYFDGGLPQIDVEDYEDLIGAPFNVFESKIAESLIDEYFDYFNEFWLNAADAQKVEEVFNKQSAVYERLKEMLK